MFGFPSIALILLLFIAANDVLSTTKQPNQWVYAGKGKTKKKYLNEFFHPSFTVRGADLMMAAATVMMKMASIWSLQHK